MIEKQTSKQTTLPEYSLNLRIEPFLVYFFVVVAVWS